MPGTGRPSGARGAGTMMITPDYCRMMARYNAWQNTGLRRIVQAMPVADLDADRGAWFGSIRATLNHLLWADVLWMSRFDGGTAPEVGMRASGTLTPTIGVWQAERFRTDGRITLWAERLRALDLTGTLRFRWKIGGREVVKPKDQMVAHFFNHQTHHRGQVHAMLTAAGQRPGDTDLYFIDEIA